MGVGLYAKLRWVSPVFVVSLFLQPLLHLTFSEQTEKFSIQNRPQFLQQGGLEQRPNLFGCDGDS